MAQPLFGPQRLISAPGDVRRVETFATVDIDNDGDADVIMSGDSTTLWYQSLAPQAAFGLPVVLADVDAVQRILPVDLDGDADTDIVVLADFEMGWFINDGGTGGLGPFKTLASGWPELADIFAADLDADGDSDLLVSGFGIGWYENLGAAILAPAPIVISQTQEVLLDVGDLDGDRDLDLLTRTFRTSPPRLDYGWRENLDGLGSFGPAATVFSVSLGMQGDIDTSAFLADVDGDGRLDVLYATNICPVGCSYELGWYVNENGLGDVFVRREISRGVGVLTIRPVDVDGDGDVDVLAGGSEGGVGNLAWYESLSGVFDAPHLVFEGSLLRPILGGADVDGDGDLDYLAQHPGEGSISVFENVDGSGFFSPPRPVTAISETDGALSVAAADLDGDGDHDVLVASRDDDGISWYSNADGRGSFGAQSIISSASKGAAAVGAADLDGDGDLDVVTAAGGNGTIAWHENSGPGSLGPENVISSQVNGVCSLEPADIDADDDIDLVASTRGGSILWFPNINGAGAFGAPTVITTSADGLCATNSTSPFSLGDLDGDGDVDVASLTDGPAVAWYANDGDGTFDIARIITSSLSDVGLGVASIRAADVDGDGDLDVLWSSVGGGNNARFRRNSGSGDFGDTEIAGTVGAAGLVAAPADVDRDGDLDLIAAVGASSPGSPGTGVLWLENVDGRGNFAVRDTVTRATDGIRSIAVTDLDGDGDVDIVSASELDDKVAWYENLATGVGVDPGTRPADFHVTPAYPNPASQSTSFIISGLRPGIVSVEVYDVLGRQWASQQVGYSGAESERIVVDVARLPRSIYACRFRLGRWSSTRAIVVL